MSGFYIKNGRGDYIPADFKQISTKDWENKLILVSIGKDGEHVPESEIDEVSDSINNSDVLRRLNGTSFLITLYNLSFEVLGSLDDISKQYIAVRVTADDDLSKLGFLQKNVKEQLRGKAKKNIIMPTPLTVEEYKEVMDVKQRCDTRRNRRGR
ncbi:MAG: hypothetical protein WC516_07175 [Patescibacteria group bacterium]|jgi:hypothetical protein